MHAVVFNVLCRTGQRPISRRTCRIVAGTRCPPSRCFHRSAVVHNSTPENPENGPDETKVEEEGTEATEGSVEVDSVAINARTRNGKTTVSGRVRGKRSGQTEGLPPFNIPDWFLEKNVKYLGDSDLSGSLAVYGERGVKGENEDNNPGSKMAAEIEQQSVEISECELNPTDSAKYSIHVDVYKEILSTLRAGLALRPPKNSNQPIPRPITLLQCPKDGGSYYLDSVVEAIALKLRADLVRLDAQDIAQLVGPHLEENLAWTLSKTSLLGYEAHKVAGKLEEYYKEPSEHDEAEGAEEEEEAIAGMPKTSKALEDLKKRLASIFTRARPDSNRSNIPKVYGPYTVTNPIISLENALFNLYKDGQQGKLATSAGAQDGWDTLKVSALFETLTTATDLKRARNSDRVVGSEDDGSVDESRNIIIQLRDYKELSGTSEGAELIGRLRQAVNKRWQMGRNIILVGTTTEEAEPALSKPEIQHLQSDIVDGEKRTIMVPPDRREEQDIAFETDEKARMRTINVRHVSDMILKLVEGTQPLSLANIDLEKDLDSSTVFSAGLEDVVWTYARVHRVATTILGLGPILSNIDGTIFSKALKILSASDEVKFSWGAEESKEEDAEVEEVLNDIDTAQKKARDKLREIEKKCTRHEKKLLSGVVLPGNIRTTFGDIRAPEETVEALKTLTSLSLIRPEAFSYGVLATDKIPGLLLYGPPGTGKTLLAKAVAKESGATVLEVSAADLNDMFVGEAEKNVRALFTLAKKLSPCVVFIDEADAIFSTRGETKRASHRELINQFLREWDGINKNLHAFIILATNRPFDLDEAVLRRTPRRLLIDLPSQKDRDEILRIHLKEELLDETVNLAKLAKETPFYSGSDLKNLAVAAALACIREENEVAAKHKGDKPYVYPEKRILTQAHFAKAMEEISASISEDMSTLTAIRKFDERYGDRKGRRKKSAALGFGGTTVVEKDSDAARVRKIEA